MTTYITRHGETKHNVEGLLQGWCDSPLTEKGIAGAVVLAKSIPLQNQPIIKCSDLGRAVSTAQIIRETLGIKEDVIVDPNLRERSFGRYEGKPINELYDVIAHMGFERSPEGLYVLDIKGVEPLAEIKRRVAQVNTDSNDRDLILVGHGLSNNYLREIKNPRDFKFYVGRDAVKL